MSAIRCRNCGHIVGHDYSVPANPSHCGHCPPWKCEDCGQMDSAAKHCRCWTPIGDLPLADIKALMAQADLGVSTP